MEGHLCVLKIVIKIEGRGQLKICYEYRILLHWKFVGNKIMEKSIFFVRPRYGFHEETRTS